ncbi:hypothetical protein GRI72_09035 [Altererythrobacter marinus]|jgi:hypothetical protein|uniref:Porin domain-containing protein n=1 Tax=Pelagerythrobacter marinus TaxID=538382 RepID=A0ABW9UYS7_9SPHN|nr:hypothetical protein [Pelagerythrobacter marinus]MEC9068186.1 hypothetical protein [Pseudomonadota bacterium]MXO68968.1 hypothetical protein [Pelagerythrobacter marinus]
MARPGNKTGKGGFAPVLLSAACLALAIPSAGMALAGIDAGDAFADPARIAPFTPASVDPELAQRVAARGQALRFTPAGPARPLDRTVTVAVRVDGETARAISFRSALAAASGEPGKAPALAATRYNLGIARGYQSFAKTPALPAGVREMDVPDLATFKPSEGVKDKPARLQPRISFERDRALGRSPRTLEGMSDQSVDLGGAYRVTRNLDVTAGVRLSQDRNRLAPLTDMEDDSQAVYVGTQFRF